MSITFTVPGPPTGKGRARIVRNKNTGRIHGVTPEKTELYENLVKLCFTENCDGGFFDKEPLVMMVIAYFSIPKSTTKKDRGLIAEGLLFPTKKPDADNIAKVICDALNGVAYGDDTQVVSLTVMKEYTDAYPRVEGYIEEAKI
jgi:Holliday junction resolvase RusA-like endonuclease